MSLFDRFRKPRWTSDSPDIRKQAYTQLQWEGPDPDTPLLTCLDRESNPELVPILLEKVPDSLEAWQVLMDCSNQALQDLLGERVSSASGKRLLSELAQAEHKTPPATTLLRLHGLFEQAGQSQAFLSALTQWSQGEKKLMELISLLPRGAARLQLAAQIEQEALLEQLQRESRGKDKRLYQYCRGKLQNQKAARLTTEKQKQQWQTHLEALEDLGCAEDRLFRDRLTLLEERRAELPLPAPPELVKKVDILHAQCLSRARALEESAQQARQIQEHHLEELTQAQTQLNQTLLSLKDSGRTLDIAERAALDGLIKSQQTRWDIAAEVVTPDPEQAQAFQAQVSELRSYCEAQGEKPEKTASDPLPNTPQSDLDKAAIDKLQKDIDQRIGQVRQHLSEGQSREAARVLDQLYDSLPAKPPSALQSSVRQIQQLKRELAELRDWAGYVATPRYEELVAKMQALVEDQREPRVKLDAIKDLQQSWKELGGQAPRKLWGEFRAASDAAYATCETWRQEQNELRTLHLQARQGMVADLEAFLAHQDWDKADWKQIATLNRQARREWSRHSPVDRKQGASLQKRFNTLLQTMDDKLNAQYRSNEKARQDLIDEAQALLLADDLQQATQRSRELQSHWKQLGPTRARQGRALWQTFRSACDELFAKLGAEKKSARETLQAEREAARARRKDDREAFLRLAYQLAQGELDTAADFEPDSPAGQLLQVAQSGEARKTSALALEIVLDLPSPAALSKQRMAIQMTHLSEQGMGSKSPAVELMAMLSFVLTNWQNPDDAALNTPQRLQALLEGAANRLGL